jgi:ATP-dependent Clp protease adaptor protein ClpS
MNTVQTPWLTGNDVCKNSLIEDAPSLSAPFSGAPAELDMPELDEEVVTKLSSRVILFNDEWHSFDEVIEQIIKATGCNYDKAEDLTWEVHNAGKAMVYEGDMGECLRVSNVLEEIMLRTQIEC